jgi:hypothetical protein
MPALANATAPAMMPRVFGRAVPRPNHGRGRSSGVEHNLAKVGVEGSNPFARSNKKLQKTAIPGGFFMPGKWHGPAPGSTNKARTGMKF